MIIRLGYVALSKTLEGITSSSTVTYTNFKKDKDYSKLELVTISNLEDLLKILKYNIKNNVHFYRLSSNLIPLATHREVEFDYLNLFQDYYKEIGDVIASSKMRVSMHPGQFCVINSTKKEVVEESINILKYHYNLLEKMNIKDKTIVIHVGSSTLGTKNSLTRFINNFKVLPEYIKEAIVVENDDKVFNIEDCIYLGNVLNIPVVLDYHHFLCNGTGKDISEYLDDIFATWKDRKPKIHFSSPKSKKEYRSHHEYINSDDFINFLEKVKRCGRDIDIMIEAKGKDEALFRLVRELKYKTNYHFIDETSFEI